MDALRARGNPLLFRLFVTKSVDSWTAPRPHLQSRPLCLTSVLYQASSVYDSCLLRLFNHTLFQNLISRLFQIHHFVSLLSKPVNLLVLACLSAKGQFLELSALVIRREL